MRRLALVPILITALLFPPAASALGLGDIELQSALNQRLDAEIPLRGVSDDTSDDIIVTLASEQAFQDVGLRRPFSLTKLRFEVRQRPGGGYYVHVTSRDPIVEPFLSFLIEVDWPGGNLLREYTVLLDPPVFATQESGEDAEADSPSTASGSQAAGVPGEIERDEGAAREEPQQQAAAEAEETAETGQASPAAEESAQAETRTAATDEPRRRGDFDDTPVFLQVEREDEEADRRAEQEAAAREAERARRERAAEEEARAQAYEPAETADSGTGAADAGAADTREERAREYGPVKRGETLWRIASRLRTGDVTVQQMMLALLRYNPEAFAGDNVNRLREGYVLRVPEREEVARISAQRAVARIGEQNALWEKWRRSQSDQATRQAQRQSGSAPEGAEAASGSGDEARLEIVGSPEGGASSDEEASATSAGDQEASQQLQALREQLESARMEKSELQSRVAELEQTVDKMEQLITLRENKLSELQDQLKQLQEQRGEEQQAVAEASDEGEEDEAVAAADGGDAGGSGETGAADAGDAPDSGDGGQAGTDDEATQTASADDGAASGTDEASGSAGQDTSDTGAGAGDDGAAGDSTTQTADASGTAGDGEASGSTAEAGADGGSAEAEATGEAGSGDTEQAAAGDAGDAASGGDGEVVTTRTQPPQQGWLDTITGFFTGIGAALGGVFAGSGLFGGPLSPGVLGIGLLVILVLVLLLVRQRRAAAASEGEESAPVFAEGEEDETPWGDVDLGQMDDSEGMVAEELSGSEGAETQDAESELMAERFDLSDLDSGDETLPAGDDEEAGEEAKDDTIAEADVYLAYGLHQQAEDLLRLALKESPQRADYQEKLLETLYAAGNRDDFVAEARSFQGMVESDRSRPWQRVLAMGQELAPDDELFAGASAADVDRSSLQPSKPASTDFELDAEGGGVDFGFDEAESESGESKSGAQGSEGSGADDTMMLDAGELEMYDQDSGLAGPSDSSSSEQTAEAGGSDASEELEFDLGDLEDFGSEEESGASGETESSDEGELEFDLSDFDEPVSETPDSEATQTAAGPASAEGDGEATQAGGASSEEDLEFDLSDFDTGGEEPSLEETESSQPDEEATAAASGAPDFDLDSDIDTSSLEDTDDSSGGDEETAAGAQGDDDALEFDLGDFDFGDPERTATSDGSATEAPEAGPELDVGELEAGEQAEGDAGDEASGDFDLDDLGGEGPGESSGSELDDEFAGAETAAGPGETAGSEAAAPSSTGEADSGGGLDFDLDLDDLGSEDSGEETLTSVTATEEPSGGPGGEPSGGGSGGSGGEAASDAESEASSGSGADMEASADDEFDTMLDLAKAYIDMGDRESAGNALEEVIESGSESQRREARELLDSVT